MVFFSLLLMASSSVIMLSQHKGGTVAGREIRLFIREAEQTAPGELGLDFDLAHILLFGEMTFIYYSQQKDQEDIKNV